MMSVLVFLHKKEHVEWHNVAIYSVQVKKSKANQEIVGHMWTDKTSTTKLVIKLSLKLHTFSTRNISQSRLK